MTKDLKSFSFDYEYFDHFIEKTKHIILSLYSKLNANYCYVYIYKRSFDYISIQYNVDAVNKFLLSKESSDVYKNFAGSIDKISVHNFFFVIKAVKLSEINNNTSVNLLHCFYDPDIEGISTKFNRIYSILGVHLSNNLISNSIRCFLINIVKFHNNTSFDSIKFTVSKSIYKKHDLIDKISHDSDLSFCYSVHIDLIKSVNHCTLFDIFNNSFLSIILDNISADKSINTIDHILIRYILSYYLLRDNKIYLELLMFLVIVFNDNYFNLINVVTKINDVLDINVNLRIVEELFLLNHSFNFKVFFKLLSSIK